MKSRFHENYGCCGIEIIEVVLNESSVYNCQYYVMWACGHASKASGNALIRRRWLMSKGVGTNLCKKCGDAYGRLTKKPAYKQKMRGPAGFKADIECLPKITPMMRKAFEARQQSRPPLR